jgi:hypothetical protein
MSGTRVLGVVILILVALWLLFAVAGAVTSLLSSVFGIIVVIAIVYGIYYYLKHH